jgi:hypothetical protein
MRRRSHRFDGTGLNSRLGTLGAHARWRALFHGSWNSSSLRINRFLLGPAFWRSEWKFSESGRK